MLVLLWRVKYYSKTQFVAFLLFSFPLDGKNNGGSKRYSRKREPTFPKAESFSGPRRTQPHKSKNFDKRPPQRGGVGGRQYGLTGGGRREEVRSLTDRFVEKYI